MSAIFYTVPQVADLLNLSVDHIYRVTKSGELGSYKIGRKVLISEEQLTNWMNTKRQYTKYERNKVADTYVALN